MRDRNKPGWQFNPGEEMFPASRIAAFQRAYSEDMGIPSEAVILTPYGHQPFSVLPPVDPEGRGKLPHSLNIEWARHPMFWLDLETRQRYPDEDPWTWAIRIDLELTARNLYNPKNGLCIDALKYFCQVDLKDPVDRLRVENYRDGHYDQLLADFYIQRDPRLPFVESRQLAFRASKALHESYIDQQHYDREGVMLLLETQVAFISTSSQVFEKGMREAVQIAENLKRAAATNNPDTIIPTKKEFSDHVQEMVDYVRDLEAHAISLEFVEKLHTEAWKYQEFVGQKLAFSKQTDDRRRVILEDMMGILYQDLSNDSHYINIFEAFKRWFTEIHAPAQETIHKINTLWEKNKLFKDHIMFTEPNRGKTPLGKELWGMEGADANPLQ